MIRVASAAVDPRALVVAVQLASFLSDFVGQTVEVLADEDGDDGDAVVRIGSVLVAAVTCEGEASDLTTAAQLVARAA